ncbi:MAG TPA: MarR family winged helix-turn-helix transcriptional regulator [Kofleriaceae bacterium]|nr:MarR family winged helix-turn-helix transcriptional regulator [Kofleriaceae bacterium]
MRYASFAEIEPIRVALVDLRRLFQRKELTALWGAAKLDYGDLRLLDAVTVALARRGSATVGDAARLLGIDASRASRQVARAVARGLLERRASQRDGRAVVLAVTPRGARLQARGSALTRRRIDHAIRGWPAAERRRFGTLFARFVAMMVA